MSNLKIDEILKHDKNYIGTYSKDNVPILKNNQSTIINLQDFDKKGSVIGFHLKKLIIKYFILILMLYHLYLTL